MEMPLHGVKHNTQKLFDAGASRRILDNKKYKR